MKIHIISTYLSSRKLYVRVKRSILRTTSALNHAYMFLLSFKITFLVFRYFFFFFFETVSEKYRLCFWTYKYFATQLTYSPFGRELFYRRCLLARLVVLRRIKAKRKKEICNFLFFILFYWEKYYSSVTKNCVIKFKKPTIIIRVYEINFIGVSAFSFLKDAIFNRQGKVNM